MLGMAPCAATDPDATPHQRPRRCYAKSISIILAIISARISSLPRPEHSAGGAHRSQHLLQIPISRNLNSSVLQDSRQEKRGSSWAGPGLVDNLEACAERRVRLDLAKPATAAPCSRRKWARDRPVGKVTTLSPY
jgi:hypothetical protein